MDRLEELASFAKLSLSGLSEQTTNIDPAIFAIIFVILFLFSASSRSWPIILGSTLLGAIGCLIVIAPSSAALLLASGACLGSLLMSLGGIQYRRRRKIQQREFERLREAVRNLETVSERQFLQSLNPRTEIVEPKESDDPP